MPDLLDPPVPALSDNDREALAKEIQRYEDCDNPDYLLADFLLGEGYRRVVVTDALVEAGAKALYATEPWRVNLRDITTHAWEALDSESQDGFRDQSRAVLVAALETTK